MTLSFDAWKVGNVAPATIDVPVRVLDAKEAERLKTARPATSDR